MPRWQYHVVNIGMFNAADRMTAAFGHLGSEGWELVALHDKASNWIGGMEKGFAVFKRLVPDGAEPEGPWARWQFAEDVGVAPRGPDTFDRGRNASGVCMASDHTACRQKWCTCACHLAAQEAPAEQVAEAPRRRRPISPG